MSTLCIRDAPRPIVSFTQRHCCWCCLKFYFTASLTLNPYPSAECPFLSDITSSLSFSSVDAPLSSAQPRNGASPTPSLQPKADEALRKLPPPFHARWFPDEFSSRAVQVALCYSYEVFLGTTPIVRAMQGFNFSNDPDSKKPKPGLIAWRAGGWVASSFHILCIITLRIGPHD